MRFARILGCIGFTIILASEVRGQDPELRFVMMLPSPTDSDDEVAMIGYRPGSGSEVPRIESVTGIDLQNHRKAIPVHIDFSPCRVMAAALGREVAIVGRISSLGNLRNLAITEVHVHPIPLDDDGSTPLSPRWSACRVREPQESTEFKTTGGLRCVLAVTERMMPPNLHLEFVAVIANTGQDSFVIRGPLYENLLGIRSDIVVFSDKNTTESSPFRFLQDGDGNARGPIGGDTAITIPPQCFVARVMHIASSQLPSGNLTAQLKCFDSLLKSNPNLPLMLPIDRPAPVNRVQELIATSNRVRIQRSTGE